MSSQTDIICFEKITANEIRIWFNLCVIPVSREYIRDFRGTNSILDHPKIEPLNIYDAFSFLKKEFADASRGALILFYDDCEFGFLRIMANPAVPTEESAETLLYNAAEKTKEILQIYAI